ncbi:MAG: Gfo/Idh/MocA family oxidoreductase [candidate division Zixibacteria bacterium]
MDKIKYGVIGVGALGRHHARWAGQISLFDFQGIYDIDNACMEEVSREIGCRTFVSSDELIKNCDAVSIAATTSYHYDIALKVIAQNKHLLIEKPITATIEQADEIIKYAEEAGVKLMVGHIERFNPAVEKLSDFDIRPSFIEAHRLAKFNPRGADVAVVLDLMIHDIDLSLYFIKSPIKEISASAVKIVSDSEDIANARLIFENGAVANLTASRISLNAMRKLRIFQTSGYFSLDLAEKQVDVYRLVDRSSSPSGDSMIPLGDSGKNIGYRQLGDKQVDMLEAELISFGESIINDAPVAISGREGRDALAVALDVIAKSRIAADRLKANER